MNNSERNKAQQAAILRIVCASVIAGIALALLRYDANCLELEFRFLIGFANGLLVFGAAAWFVERLDLRIALRDYALRFAGMLLIVSALSALLSYALLTGPAGVLDLLPADLVVLVAVPVALSFAATVYVIYLLRTTRRLAGLRELAALPSERPAQPDTVGEPPAPPQVDLRFRTDGRWQSVPLAEIVYIASQGKRSTVHTIAADYATPMLLKDLLGDGSIADAGSGADRLLRIHKSFAVNLRFADSAGVRHRFGGSYYLRLRDEDDTELPVGRSYLARLRAR